MKNLLPLLLFAIIVFSGCDKDNDEDLVPVKILINKITVTRFPQLNAGSTWDFFDGPDIYPVIGSWSGYAQNADNATSSNQYNFIPSPSIEITNLNGVKIIELYDFDSTSGNDFMGSVNFVPNNKIDGKPESFTVDAGGSVAFILYVDYVY